MPLSDMRQDVWPLERGADEVGLCGGELLGGFAFLASAASCLLLIFLFRTICVLTPIGADRPGQEIP